jgi:hypothetical protein
MKTSGIVLLALALAAPTAAEPGLVALGILPTRDTSGVPGATSFVKALPTLLFERLGADAEVKPMLLNPGGSYSALEEEWALEYSRLSGVDAALATTFARAPGKGKFTVTAVVISPRSGRRSVPASIGLEIENEKLDRAAFYDGAAFFGRNKRFEKERVGRAAKKVAAWLAPLATAAALDVGAPGSFVPPPAFPGSCPVTIRVRYKERGTASKNYVLVVNGREESLGVVDGIATTSVAKGRVVLHVSVKDAPYKLPIQDSYSANIDLGCEGGKSSLVLEIGAIGEAFLRAY